MVTTTLYQDQMIAKAVRLAIDTLEKVPDSIRPNADLEELKAILGAKHDSAPGTAAEFFVVLAVEKAVEVEKGRHHILEDAQGKAVRQFQ